MIISTKQFIILYLRFIIKLLEKKNYLSSKTVCTQMDLNIHLFYINLVHVNFSILLIAFSCKLKFMITLSWISLIKAVMELYAQFNLQKNKNSLSKVSKFQIKILIISELKLKFVSHSNTPTLSKLVNSFCMKIKLVWELYSNTVLMDS